MIRDHRGVPGVLYNQVGGQLWHLKTHFEFYPFLKNRGVLGGSVGGVESQLLLGGADTIRV